jgi:purine-binding chemotaxis protein CheW
MAQTHGTLVTFELGDLRLAIAADRVREVVRAVAIAPLPGAPAVVDGVIDVRGSVIPVFDTRYRFGLPSRPLSPDEHFLIVDAGDRDAALRVDRAGWLIDIPESAVMPRDRVTAGAPHVAGTVTLNDGVVLIHDVGTFLARAEAETLDAALRRRADAAAGESPRG